MLICCEDGDRSAHPFRNCPAVCGVLWTCRAGLRCPVGIRRSGRGLGRYREEDYTALRTAAQARARWRRVSGFRRGLKSMPVGAAGLVPPRTVARVRVDLPLPVGGLGRTPYVPRDLYMAGVRPPTGQEDGAIMSKRDRTGAHFAHPQGVAADVWQAASLFYQYAPFFALRRSLVSA